MTSLPAWSQLAHSYIGCCRTGYRYIHIDGGSGDIYYPHAALLDALNAIVRTYELCAPHFLRKAALERACKLVVYKDENTSYQDLGPVNKMLNLICRAHVEGLDSEAYKMHKLKRLDFMWIGSEGMMSAEPMALNCGMSRSWRRPSL